MQRTSHSGIVSFVHFPGREVAEQVYVISEGLTDGANHVSVETLKTMRQSLSRRPGHYTIHACLVRATQGSGFRMWDRTASHRQYLANFEGVMSMRTADVALVPKGSGLNTRPSGRQSKGRLNSPDKPNRNHPKQPYE
jgi:hypothetical protein